SITDGKVKPKIPRPAIIRTLSWYAKIRGVNGDSQANEVSYDKSGQDIQRLGKDAFDVVAHLPGTARVVNGDQQTRISRPEFGRVLVERSLGHDQVPHHFSPPITAYASS